MTTGTCRGLGPSCGNYFFTQRLTDLVGKYRPQSSAHHHLPRTFLWTTVWGGKPHDRQKASSGLSINLRHWVPEPENLRRVLRRLVVARKRSPGSSFKRRHWTISRGAQVSHRSEDVHLPPRTLAWAGLRVRFALSAQAHALRLKLLLPASRAASKAVSVLPKVGNARANELKQHHLFAAQTGLDRFVSLRRQEDRIPLL